MTLKRIALHLIAVDAGTQVRAAINEPTVTDYAEQMESGVTFPPIVLFHDGNQHYLADGFHRVMAAQRIQWREIDADVRTGTKQDALWCALGANKANGQRLTISDRRHAIKLAVEAWPERSGAQIAEQIGCSPQYVSTVKSGMTTTCDRIVTKTGQVRMASSSAAHQARLEAADLLRQGLSVEAIRKQLRIGRDVVFEIKRSLGMSVDKSKAGVQERREQMRKMASDGHTSRQIASAVGISEESCRVVMRKEGIVVPADKTMRGTHRHDSNRIIERIVLDAENLTEGVTLVDFGDLHRDRLAEWLRSLSESRDKLSAFIRRLIKEQQNGQAA
jgi:ParB-like chromosome segregation protein Spo0J